MLLSMPLIFSNLPQALEGGKTGRCLMQLMPVILGMIPGLYLGVRVLLALDATVAKIIAGLVLMGVRGVTLLAPKLQLQSRLVLPTGITFGLVRPFELSLPAGFAYYLVYPPRAALNRPNVKAFRDWLMAEARSRTK
jgi:DNA-binding transcriptional LysR family regulator